MRLRIRTRNESTFLAFVDLEIYTFWGGPPEKSPESKANHPLITLIWVTCLACLIIRTNKAINSGFILYAFVCSH